MKIIKLDGRHKYRRENNMQYAIVFDSGYSIYTSRYEHWLTERYGSRWIEQDWISGYPAIYKTRKYYIAVKDPAILTMMALTFNELIDN